MSVTIWAGALVVITLGMACGLTFTKAGADYLLRHQLTYLRHLPESPSSSNDVVYVLGGTSDSVKARLRTASSLIGSGKAARVLLGTRKHECGRESLGALGLGIDAECVAFEEGVFGTWSEAKALSRIAREQGYRRLILVTSPYHGRRVWESFSSTVEQPDVRLYLYLSNEPVDRRNLLPEYVKLLVYRAVLL
jgi:uncharacterized SAM-binding protein YcdF (DUF218 family)